MEDMLELLRKGADIEFNSRVRTRLVCCSTLPSLLFVVLPFPVCFYHSLWACMRLKLCMHGCVVSMLHSTQLSLIFSHVFHVKTQRGCTALMGAVQRGQTDCVRELLKAGANKNAKTGDVRRFKNCVFNIDAFVVVSEVSISLDTVSNDHVIYRYQVLNISVFGRLDLCCNANCCENC